jgi:nucleotide-binding universal stress UspA family protein
MIVPLDGSRRAEQILPYARLLAHACGARVELLRVEDADVTPPFWPPLPGPEYLKDVAARYFGDASTIDTVEARGKPASVIAARAQAHPSALIAMTTHGLSGLKRWLLGSVASKVVQTAVNPVLLIRSLEDQQLAAEPALKRVVIPLDGSALAEIALREVIPLARNMELAVDLVRVYSSSPAESYPMGDMPYMENLARHREALRREAETYLEGKTQELGVQGLEHVNTTVILGDAAAEIIDLARNTPDNLIAMTTHGRSGIERWVLGSVAEKVVQHSRDPVLLVRPTETQARG